MGAELLIFLTWLGKIALALWTYLITVGTNELIIKLFLGNILLWGIITYITPGTKDNAFFDWLKGKISNFKNKGEDIENEEIK